MNTFSNLMRYVGELDPPTRWTKLEECFAEQQQGQGEGVDVAAEVCRQVFHRKLNTIKQMLNQERPLCLLEFELVRRYIGLPVDEATALYVANAPAPRIAQMVRAHEAAPPHMERVACVAPKPFIGPRFVYTRHPHPATPAPPEAPGAAVAGPDEARTSYGPQRRRLYVRRPGAATPRPALAA